MIHFLLFTLLLFSCNLWGQAQVLHILGNAEKISAGQSTPLHKGDSLSLNDEVKTLAKSLIIVRLPPQSTIKILENSQLKIADLTQGQTQIELQSGGVLVQFKKSLSTLNVTAPPNLKLKTTHASMGVRGTEFFASTEKNQDWMCVREGAVEVVKDNNTEIVTAGLGVHITPQKNLEKPKAYKWTQKIKWEFNPENIDASQTLVPKGQYQDRLKFDYD